MDLSALPDAVIEEILIRAGSWLEGGHGSLRRIVTAGAVCRAWRSIQWGRPINMARMLVHAHGAEEALVRASAHGAEEVVRCILKGEVEGNKVPRPDCQYGRSLIEAAGGGHEGVVRLLLGWPQNAPRADCEDGRAFIVAAGGVREGVVRLLL